LCSDAQMLFGEYTIMYELLHFQKDASPELISMIVRLDQFQVSTGLVIFNKKSQQILM
jgi:hypothetical protein